MIMRCEICKESDPGAYEMSGLPCEFNGIYHTILCPMHINMYKAFSRNNSTINEAHSKQVLMNAKKLNPELTEWEAIDISKDELMWANTVAEVAEGWMESMKLVARSAYTEKQND